MFYPIDVCTVNMATGRCHWSDVDRIQDETVMRLRKFDRDATEREIRERLRRIAQQTEDTTCE